MKTLFKEGHIVSVNENNEVVTIKNGYLGIENDKIIYIGENCPIDKYDVEKNMKDKMIIPSLHNDHTHAAMTLLRGVGSDLSLMDWLEKEIWPIEDKLKKQHISSGANIAIMESLSTGTSCFTDMYFEQEATIEQVVKSGINLNTMQILISFNEDETFENIIKERPVLEFHKKYNGYNNGQILVDFGIHAEYTFTEKLCREYADAVKDVNGSFHLHLSETQFEHENCIKKYGKTPTKWFNDLGVLNSKTTAAHCVWVSDEDIEILKEKDVTVVHNPSSNMKLGSGFAPIRTMLNKGIKVTLGTDGAASNNNLNMLEEVHLTSIIHKGFEKNPTIINPATVLKMATSAGYRRNSGSLEVGKQADIVAIDLNKAHLIPHNDLLNTLVYSASGQDVCMTMVNGKVLYENGVYLTIDAEKTIYDFKEMLKTLY